MKTSDVIASAVLVAFGLIALLVVIPWQVADVGAAGLPPRGMPTFTAGAVTILSAALLVKSLFSQPGGAAPFDPRQFLALVLGVAITVAGTLTFIFVGFIAGGLFTIIVLMLLMGERDWRILAAVPIGAVGLTYLFMTRVLHVAVP